MDFPALKNAVEFRLGATVYQSIWKFVRSASPNLWGTEQPRHYVEIMLNLAIYKDIKGVGFQRLISKMDQNKLGIKLNCRTLEHNIHHLRGILKSWGRDNIVLGNADAWTAAARSVIRPAPFQVKKHEKNVDIASCAKETIRRFCKCISCFRG